MTIPSVIHGLIELEDGKVFELDSPKGLAWLESVGSFRFEPSADNKPYTVRKESGKGGDYWYGYRKQNGKLHKKYIGKSSELSTAKLEEIAEALNTPPQPRVTDKVTEVADTREEVVTDKVTDTHDGDRLTALELQVQALQESLKALRSELPGKSDAGNFEELPTVTDNGLQIELGNLKGENQTLRQELEEVKVDRAKLLESSSRIKTKLESEVRELRSQLETERADREEVEAELTDREEQMRQLLSELAALKQKSATARGFPDLTEKSGELLSLFKSLLPAKAKLPNGLVSKIRKILEGTQDE